MIKYLFTFGLIGCTGDLGVSADDLLDPRGLPAGGSAFSEPPECSSGCFVKHTSRPYLSAYNFIPDGEGGAKAWLQSDTQGVSFEGDEDLLFVNTTGIQISSSGEFGDIITQTGQLALSGVWEVDDQLLMASNYVEVYTGQEVGWGQDTALFPYNNGFYGEGTIWQNSTAGRQTAFDVNASGAILWSGAHPSNLRIDDENGLAEYDSTLPYSAVTLFDADHSIIYINSMNTVPQKPEEIALADDNSVYLALHESVLWDGTETAVSHPDFTTRGVFARATPTGELDWYVPVSAVGNAGITLGTIVPDGSGGAWAVVNMAGNTDLTDIELNLEIGDERFVAPTGRQLNIALLVHIQSDGSVTSIISPYPIAPPEGLAYANVNITNLAPTPDGGVLALGNVQVAQSSTGGTVYLDGGPIDFGGLLTNQTGTWLAHIDAADSPKWARVMAAAGTNGFPGHITIDGDYAWIVTSGYGEFTWDGDAPLAEGTPPYNAAMLRIKWQ